MSFRKPSRLTLPSGVVIRESDSRDASDIASLFSREYGGDATTLEPLIEQELKRASMGLIQRKVYVAERGDQIIGYGRSGRLDRQAIKGSRGLDPGWYLLGLVVHSKERRCGIGHALTAFRLKKMRKLSPIVYYFAAHDNAATIALHESFGFQLVETDFHHPNPIFKDGEGLLFRKTGG